MTIAVLDTGVDIDHQSLENNIWVNTGEIQTTITQDDNDGEWIYDEWADAVMAKSN